jgi:L-threonylcarbamoyladenylate synthase
VSGAQIVSLDPSRPAQAFSRCRDVIASGGVIVYPTDTFYGLGVDPRNAAAVKRLFAIKERQEGQPILLLIADADDLQEWVDEVTPHAEGLMRKFWPGPLTLVFKARPTVLADLTAQSGTIGLRVPGNELTRSLLRSVGRALTGTSANISGRPSPRTAQEAAAIAARVDLILDGGETAGGQPSTIVDVSRDVPRVIREGAVPASEVVQ